MWNPRSLMDESTFLRELQRYPVVRGADWVRDWSRPRPGGDTTSTSGSKANEASLRGVLAQALHVIKFRSLVFS